MITQDEAQAEAWKRTCRTVCKDEIESLEKQLAEAKKDAERYRFIRSWFNQWDKADSDKAMREGE